ncbi:hypothetical protein RJ640_026787 [Escallonia rubra]|uniref:Protein kinase domain-containing protein n=1 Tax=Escallonia rubra TaxID=112253 RepID=A0AA88QG63_9ASTE|nr:hypothetical protein RJ640_026787 [Escallonia rubra]
MFPCLISVKEKTIKSGNKSASPNKDGDIDQEIPPSGQNVTQKVKVFTVAELKIAMGNSVLEAGRAFWVDKKTYAPSKAGIGMAVTVEQGAQPLPWVTRLKIAIEAAQALAFLHTTENQVMYFSFTASKILLDGDFNPMLIGFGIDLGCDHEIPDMTDRRVYDSSRPYGESNLVSWVRAYLTDKRRHKRIMDARLKDEYPSRGSFQVALLAQSCLGYKPKDRPSMEEVLEVLKKVSAI